ncbi:carbonic anhydrase 2-like protein [Aphelenchoides avenae]|nr:carbonic anhydrase 2-like protein [Aphelenchus avenae]
MLRLGVLALICMTVASGHGCGRIDTTYNNAEDRKFDDLRFHDYDSKFDVNASFVGAVGRIDGFNASTSPACISGGGLEEPHCLVSVSVFGDYDEDASAHSIDGRHYAFELQLLHRSKRGTTVILSIFGGTHYKSFCWFDECTRKSLDPVISALKTANKDHVPARIEALSPYSFLPSNTRPFYMYVGTVINECATVAKYFVLKDRVQLPASRMDKFRYAFANRSGRKDQQHPVGLVYRRCCL